MSQFNLPDSPFASRFGWPATKRVEEFEKLKTVANLATSRVVFQGKPQDIPIIRVPLGLPKYRMANGRTVSSQEEYLAKHSSARGDLFSGDPELLDAQGVQHDLLVYLAKQAELLDYFKDPTNKQVDPILLDENGFVVNGNRRLATWRKLLEEDHKKYGHFSHIDVVVLPHCDEQEIDRLEAALQIQKDIKADYTWDTLANMMLQKQKRDNSSDNDIADLYSMKESDVRELIDMRNYASDYLRSRDKANHWSLVSADEFAFRKLLVSRSKLPNAGEQELFKQAAYILIDKTGAVGGSVGGRLYEAIPSIQEYLDQIKGKLQERYKVQPVKDAGGFEDLFGGPAQAGTDPISIPLAAEIQKPENMREVRQIIVEVIETQRQLKKESKAERYLIESLAKAQAILAAAIKDGLRPESKRTGALAQVQALKSQIAQIEKWLSDHA